MIPRCFSNETVVIIASGASLTQEDVDYCKGKARVAVINDNYKKAEWADLLYAADLQWWDYYNGVPDFKGEKYTQDEIAARKYNLKWVAGRWASGIGHEVIHYGYNSGFQCANLVYLMGAKRILLLGFDMQRTNKLRHWFGNHPAPLHKESNYDKWRELMDKAAKHYAKVGVDVINCSRQTALTEYRRSIITEEL